MWGCSCLLLRIQGLLAADKPSIQAAGDGYVGGPLHQRPPVRKYRDRIVSSLKPQQKPVEVHLAMRFQAALHLGKIDRAVMFMNLHRIAPAKRDLDRKSVV